MAIFIRARLVIVPAVCLGLAIWGLGADGGSSQPIIVPTVGDAAKCVDPARSPDKSAPPPHMVSTFPAEGAVVRPGIVVVRLNFDQPMSCYGIFQSSPNRKRPCSVTIAQPDAIANGRRSFDVQDIWYGYDRRSLEITCKLAANTPYGLRMNPGSTDDFIGAEFRYKKLFKSVAGWSLGPFELTFSTSSGPEITSLKEAQAQEAAGGQIPILRETN